MGDLPRFVVRDFKEFNEAGEQMNVCDKCFGAGIKVIVGWWFGFWSKIVKCPACDGTGSVPAGE